jgi:type IX secretion system PorP/SprF family membrane protein
MRKAIKKLVVLGMGLVLLQQTQITAQQDYLASQYNFNALMLNPAYAGAHSYLQTTAMYRNQWSVEGAPTTQVLCVDGLLKNAPIGIGVVMTTDRIGVTSENTFSADLSYHLRTSLGKISLGLRGGYVGYRAALDDLVVWDNGDPVYDGGNVKEGFLTLGFGAFFSATSGRWFGGVSIPNYYASDDVLRSDPDVRFYKRHIYTYAGGVVSTPLGIELKPSILVRYTEGVPLTTDINLHALLMEDGPGGTQVWLGVGYRTKSVLLASIEIALPYDLRLGYAYDFMGAGLQDALGSTHEILLGFNFGGQTPLIQNPRYF